MKSRFTRLCFLVALLAATWQAGNAKPAYAGAILPNVVVTHPVIMPLMEALLDGVTKPEGVMSRAIDAHSAMLSPSDVAKLNNADIIIAVDDSVTLALTPWLKEKKNPRAMVLVLTHYDAASPLPYRTKNSFLPESSMENPDKQIDPHIWLDPLRMASIMPPLAKDIGTYNTEFSAQLADNAQRLAMQLRAVTYPKTKAMLEKALQEESRFTPPFPIIPVLTQHDAFQYFYDRYRIADGGYLVRHSGPMQGAASLKDIYKNAGKTRVRCILSSEPSRTVTRVRELSKARVITLNPEHTVSSHDVPAEGWFTNDYDRFVANVTRQFAACLR